MDGEELADVGDALLLMLFGLALLWLALVGDVLLLAAALALVAAVREANSCISGELRGDDFADMLYTLLRCCRHLLSIDVVSTSSS